MSNANKNTQLSGRDFIDGMQEVGPEVKLSEKDILARNIIAKANGGAVVYPETARRFARVLRGEGAVSQRLYNGHKVTVFAIWTEAEKAQFLAAQAAKKAISERELELLKKQDQDITAPVKDLGAAVSASTPKRAKVTA